ncbi:uncharacterized protein N7496_011543 [Penicillium cataractarum]|uniref:Atos-like conserved domain-containing protein n=1 Tax=Penicillium cataractarum TaxID=2100454 RepID=A0A9W9RGJ8_9EURO|nr:uncharacterized protein N7496_011543 [Penicillium cataractarum]KAJ5359130.1 hypothetical protein N7496_011543 [Penicillium cataractarum]
MPLFHDPDRRAQHRWSGDHSEPEQPAPGSPRDQAGEDDGRGRYIVGSAGMAIDYTSMEPSPSKIWANDRQELIQRIKESSPWRLQYQPQNTNTCESYTPHSSIPPLNSQADERMVEQVSENQRCGEDTEELGSPAEIQRPRSALHSGDFREGSPHHGEQSPQPRFAEPSPSSPFPRLGTSPTTPWFGAAVFQSNQRQFNPFSDRHEPEHVLQSRSRAPSLGSFSSSYVLKAPTSPLVYQANNTDLDFSPRVDSAEPLGPLERANRRRTLPPETFRHLHSSPPNLRTVNIGSPCPKGRQDGHFQPHHAPRRSLALSYSLQLASTANTPAFRARRPSLASEISPKPHAPMVGSYEESILRGRMSMNPSKPLDFTAQIGVLGKGNCKGHLRCPPHVTVPFPAVFYSYPTSGNGRSIADDSPSPYVGQIDLENSLPKDGSSTTRRRKHHFSPSKAPEEIVPIESGAQRAPDADSRRRREKKNRRAESPRCPPGGSYRIPQQGQLQIIIKNPHKTAVKLFLVPYDLSDMEPGTKTFIRQRSYSAGPIIDMPLSVRKNYGTDRPEASLNPTEDPQDKPILRYLVHLNICCPSRGRFYLHSSIRVVFANRVPDGKEKLRNEIQLPEPRYSPYKPVRENPLSTSAGARLAIEKAARRRSAGQSGFPVLPSYISSPSDGPLHWDESESMDLVEPSQTSRQSGTVYNKLNKGDVGYGGYPYASIQSGSENGESLLAKRLRGLDVHKHEAFDNN